MQDEFKVSVMKVTTEINLLLSSYRLYTVKLGSIFGLRLSTETSLAYELKGYFSLNNFYAWQLAKGKIQRNNYHHGSCETFLRLSEK